MTVTVQYSDTISNGCMCVVVQYSHTNSSGDLMTLVFCIVGWNDYLQIGRVNLGSNNTCSARARLVQEGDEVGVMMTSVIVEKMKGVGGVEIDYGRVINVNGIVSVG